MTSSDRDNSSRDNPEKERAGSDAADIFQQRSEDGREALDRPRLTPQARSDRTGEGDSTAPGGGAATGNPDKAEG